MTAEVSTSGAAPRLLPEQGSMDNIIEDKVLEEARSIFRKFSITLGSRKNSTKSLKTLEEQEHAACTENSSDAADDAESVMKRNQDGKICQAASAPDAPREQQAGQDEQAKKKHDAAEPELYLKSGDYQEGDSLAIYDFDGGAAVATSTPLAASSGDNSAVDVSHDLPVNGDAGLVEGKDRGGADSNDRHLAATRENQTPQTRSASNNNIITDEENCIGDDIQHLEDKCDNNTKNNEDINLLNEDSRNGLKNKNTINHSKNNNNINNSSSHQRRGSKEPVEKSELNKGQSSLRKRGEAGCKAGKKAVVANGHIVSPGPPHRTNGGAKNTGVGVKGGGRSKTQNLSERLGEARRGGHGQPPSDQDHRTGNVGLFSDEERETDTFREAFDDVHETSVVDLRVTPGFLNRSAPDLNASGDDSSVCLGNRLNNTTYGLVAGQGRHGQSLHDLAGQSVVSHSQRRSKYSREHVAEQEEYVVRGKSSCTRRVVIIKKSPQQIRHTSSAVVKATRVSLIDESGELEDFCFEGEENIAKFLRSAITTKSATRSTNNNSMSLSIAVSVKELGDSTTQTSATHGDGPELKASGAAGPEEFIVPQTAIMTGSKDDGDNQEVQYIEHECCSESGLVKGTDSSQIAETHDAKGEENVNSENQTQKSPENPESVDEVDATRDGQTPIVDTHGNEVGAIENTMSGSVEDMIASVATVTSAIVDAVASKSPSPDKHGEKGKKDENKVDKTSRDSSAHSSTHDLASEVGPKSRSNEIQDKRSAQKITSHVEPAETNIDEDKTNRLQSRAAANSDPPVLAVDSLTLAVDPGKASVEAENEDPRPESTEQSDVDGMERGTPSTDLADKGYYESDVTTPGDQMVEVNVDTTPESNPVEDGAEDGGQGDSTCESRLDVPDTPSPLSAISERAESAVEIPANAELESKGLGQTDPDLHPGDGEDTDEALDEESLFENSGVVFIDNGQSVSANTLCNENSTNRKHSVSPSASTNCGSSAGSSSRSASAVSQRSTKSAASQENRQESAAGASPNASRMTSAAASSKDSRGSSVTPSPKNARVTSAATVDVAINDVDSKAESGESSPATPKEGSRTSSLGIARGKTFVKDDHESLSSPGLIESAKAIVEDTVERATRTLSASLHSTVSLSHEDSRSITTSEDVITVIEAHTIDGKESRLSGDTVILEKADGGSIGGGDVARPVDTEDAEDTAIEDISANTSPAAAHKIKTSTVSDKDRVSNRRLSHAEHEVKDLPVTKFHTSAVIEPAETNQDNETSHLNKNKLTQQPRNQATTNTKPSTSSQIPGYSTAADAPIEDTEVAASSKAMAHAPKRNHTMQSSLENAESNGLRSPDSKATSLDDSMSIPNDSGHATEEDRGSSAEIRRSDIAEIACAPTPAQDSEPVSSIRKSVPSIRRAPKSTTANAASIPKAAPAKARKSPGRTSRRNRSPPPPEKYLARLKRSKSEGVSLHKLASSGGNNEREGGTSRRAGSRGSENVTGSPVRTPEGGRLSRLQSRSVAEMEQQRHDESTSTKKEQSIAEQDDRFLAFDPRLASQAAARRRERPGAAGLSRAGSAWSPKSGRSSSSPDAPDRCGCCPQKYLEKLRTKLDHLRAERRECEMQKEEMVKQVRSLQTKLVQEKESVHDLWRKKYFEEKKITPKQEEESSKLRQELERIHRDLITKVEGREPNDARSPFTRLEEPSNKLSYKIMISGLLREIEDLKRRLESTKLRLSAEAKLRAMAEKDVRTLREDLIQKKIQIYYYQHHQQQFSSPNRCKGLEKEEGLICHNCQTFSLKRLVEDVSEVLRVVGKPPE